MSSGIRQSDEFASRPAGWRHNPSSQGKRLLIEVLALCGAGISLYLALYQFGVIAPVWDPVFGSTASRAILHSSFSRSLPIPDGLLGFFAYLAEFAASRFGDERRWNSAPWKVALNSAIAAALVLAAFLLVSLQGLVYHHWCTLCLCSATLSVSIGFFTADEAFASTQHVLSIRRAGGNALLAFAGKRRLALMYARIPPAA